MIAKSHPTARGLVTEFDLRIGSSRLQHKVIVFRTRRDLRSFWRRTLGRSLEKNVLAAVRPMLAEAFDPRDMSRRLRFEGTDPRYVSIMGLVLGHLGTEILCHESVHAAIYHSHRVGWRKRWINDPEHEEPDERICYPAGRIMAAIVRNLRKKGLIE